MTTARATTGIDGRRLAYGFDLTNLRPIDVISISPVWQYNITISDRKPLGTLINSPVYDLIAREALKDGASLRERVTIGSSGRTLMLRTERTEYRQKKSNIYKRKRDQDDDETP